ncbi:MAG: DUF3137 domain-containing protein [Reichenbachiella sp.]
MKTIAELQAIFETQLKPSLESIEIQRIGIRKKIHKTVLTFLIIPFHFLLVYLSIVFEFPDALILFVSFPLFLSAPTLVVLTCVFAYKSWKPYNGYKKAYKETVVAAVVKSINPTWKYSFDQFISKKQYHASKLFKSRLDRYNGDDLVTGTIEKTDFRMSELHTMYKTQSTDSKGNKKTTWHTIFKGLFAHIDFNKAIKGETQVLTDTAEKMFGSFGKKLQSIGSGGKLVKLENIEFEKEFVVYGSDQNEARYILTPAMMEAMLTIKKAYDREVQFSFIGTRVYIAMNFKKDLFEPKLSRPVDFEDVKQMNEQFNLISIIIHEMNLNTRIWTKE